MCDFDNHHRRHPFSTTIARFDDGIGTTTTVEDGGGTDGWEAA